MLCCHSDSLGREPAASRRTASRPEMGTDAAMDQGAFTRMGASSGASNDYYLICNTDGMHLKKKRKKKTLVLRFLWEKKK